MQKISVLNVFQEIKEKFENINKEKESTKKKKPEYCNLG